MATGTESPARRSTSGPLADFAAAVTAALAFLERHTNELAALSRCPSVHQLQLLVPTAASHREGAVRLPQRLVEVAAAAGVREAVSGRRV